MKFRRTHLIVALSALAHLLVLALLLRVPAQPTIGALAGGMPVSLFDGKALAPQLRPPAQPPAAPPHPPSARKAEPTPPAPSDVVPQYVDFEPPADPTRLDRDLSKDPVAQSVAAAASNAAGHACQVGVWLQQALQADPEVQRALASVPRTNRSVANALMLWDAHWVRQAQTAVAGVSVIRAALEIGVRSAPPACQIEVVRGPELLILADASGTTLLAIGSGEWRWSDLLTDDPIVATARPG